MILKRTLLHLRFEEHWFDERGYLDSDADLVAVRSHAPVKVSQCRFPERTLLVPLDRSETDIEAGFDARAKTSLRQARKTLRVERARTEAERELFYQAYIPFAKTRGLLIPKPAEEMDLEIFLARDPGNEVVQAAAFLPAREADVYRYRYGVYIKKSQANALLLFEGMRRAKELGIRRFDVGGITPGARPGTPEAGINFFKSQFGGNEIASHLYLRAKGPLLRVLLRGAQATGLSSHYRVLSRLVS